MEEDASEIKLLTLAKKGLTRKKILKELNLSNNKYYGMVKKEFQTIQEQEEYKQILKENLDRKSKKNKSVIILADDYLISYTGEKLINDTCDTMYILPQTLEYIHSIKETATKPAIIFFKIIDALNTTNSNIKLFEKYTFYDKGKNCDNNIDHLIKTSLFLKSNGFQVTIFTNDLNTIYYALVNDIKVCHSINTNLNTEKIRKSYNERICIYDTCYLLGFITKEEIYDNFPKKIYSCVLEEIIKNYKEIKSIDNLFYILVDCIQDPNFNVTFQNTISNYAVSRAVWNDSIILFNILKEVDYKNKILLKTADCKFENEALLYGVKLSIIDYDTNNKENQKISTNEDIISENQCISKQTFSSINRHMTIPLKKKNSSWYISLEEKEKNKFEFILPRDFEKIKINRSKEIDGVKYFEIKINDYILVDKKFVYKLVNTKDRNNFKFAQEI